VAGLSEAVLRVGAAALGLGDGAGEGPGAGAHLDGAVAGGPHVRVHTHAAVHADGQARRALAAEGALGVGAASVHANARGLALVDVWVGRGRRGGGAESHDTVFQPGPCVTSLAVAVYSTKQILYLILCWQTAR